MNDHKINRLLHVSMCILLCIFSSVNKVNASTDSIARVRLTVYPPDCRVSIDGISLTFDKSLQDDDSVSCYIPKHITQGEHFLLIDHADRKYWPVRQKIWIGPDNILFYRLKREAFVSTNDIYIGALGAITGLEFGLPLLCIGGHLERFNIEASCDYLFGRTDNLFVSGLKLGWGILYGPRLKLTPQAGFKYIHGERSWLPSISLRMYFPLRSHFGISVVPEYDVAALSCKAICTYTF